MMVEWKEKELERRLGLYQVFLKLYEHHSSLLDEILKLENLYQPSLTGVKPLYIQGVVDTSVVYVVTNLCESTQSLRQPQQIWTIGRDRGCGIQIADRYLSRHHAAIQYVEQQGFYLIDFNSTNGSYVNGELVYQPVLLKDGDRISLGNMTFYFFINHSHRVLPTVAVELLMQLVPLQQPTTNGDSLQPRMSWGVEDLLNKAVPISLGKDSPTNASDRIQILTSPLETEKHLAAKLDDVQISKDTNLIEKLQHQIHNLSAEQQSDILDRFFNRQTSDK